MVTSEKSAVGCELLIAEIMLELKKLPPERLAAAYRELRTIRGRKLRPETGPLVVREDQADREG